MLRATWANGRLDTDKLWTNALLRAKERACRSGHEEMCKFGCDVLFCCACMVSHSTCPSNSMHTAK